MCVLRDARFLICSGLAGGFVILKHAMVCYCLVVIFNIHNQLTVLGIHAVQSGDAISPLMCDLYPHSMKNIDDTRVVDTVSHSMSYLVVLREA